MAQPAVSNGLQITYLPIEGPASWGDHGEQAWRVAYGWEGDLLATPVPFVRRRDAELALRALEQLEIFFGSPREIVQRARGQGLGSRDIRRIMLEALEW